MSLTNKPTKVVCKLPKKRKNAKMIEYLKRYRYKLLKCFKKKRVFVNSSSLNTIKNSYSQTTIKTEPIRFTVKFNNGFGIISTFIEK